MTAQSSAMADSGRSARLAASIEATQRMNQMYRWQRSIYDVTRRYYLLGRDQLIAGLHPRAGDAVLEIGSGTGRNLICAAQRYPYATFFGVDVSTEMLTTALAAITRARLDDRIRVRHGDATAFDAEALFGRATFDHLMISYSLSMIPHWRRVLEAAVNLLGEGGQLHVVDFGHCERLPTFVRALLLRWLALFDVTPRRGLEQALREIAMRRGATLVMQRPFRGYAHTAVLTLPAARK